MAELSHPSGPTAPPAVGAGAGCPDITSSQVPGRAPSFPNDPGTSIRQEGTMTCLGPVCVSRRAATHVCARHRGSPWRVLKSPQPRFRGRRAGPPPPEGTSGPTAEMCPWALDCPGVPHPGAWTTHNPALAPPPSEGDKEACLGHSGSSPSPRGARAGLSQLQGHQRRGPQAPRAGR